ncbi:MAG: hypothetical protein BroJett040_09960 [Oligoflexia bacterium]|nr:MAG: hypothetical protein BroJett040_09960 [Oligoflexia bacterium]
MKKIIALIACVYLVGHLTACTSKKAADDGGELGAEDIAAETSPEAGLADETNAGFVDEQLPEDTLGAQAEQTPPPAEDTSQAEAPPPPVEMPQEQPPAPVAPTEEKPTDTVAAVDPGAEKKEEPPAPKPVASLKKIKEVPFREGGQLLNAVYIARPGDDYSSISKMIYGTEDKASDIKKANYGAKVKPGNKIYYNSPKRPDDETKMLTYYEDMGMMPEIYVAKDGDNIRAISKDLLGYPEAWKEVWATNTVESKGALPGGAELKYWKNAPAPQTEVAVSTPPPPTEPVAPPMPSEMPAPPPPPVEAAAPPPPPPADLPPPPPPEPVAPPPPPPPAPVAKKAPKVDVVGQESMDQDTMMALAGAGVIAAGLAAIIVIRKRRAQKQSAQAFDSQVGT